MMVNEVHSIAMDFLYKEQITTSNLFAVVSLVLFFLFVDCLSIGQSGVFTLYLDLTTG